MSEKSNTPKCNHCGYEFGHQELWCGDQTVYTDCGDDTELVCPNDDCKKTFYVICERSLSFSNIDEDGEEV